MASEQSEAESKEQVLKSLSQAAIQIAREAWRIAQLSFRDSMHHSKSTTASMEALKAYSLASDQSSAWQMARRR